MNTTHNESGLRGNEALSLLGLDTETEARDSADPSTAVGASDAAAIGRRVAEARAKSSLSGTQLGTKVGLGRDQISKIEAGKRRLAPRELPSFATALGVTIRYLLGAHESPQMALAHRLSQSADEASTPGSGDLPGTQRLALELLKVESLLASQTELAAPRWSVHAEQVRRFAQTHLASRPRNKAEAQRQGRRLAEEVRSALDLGSAEIRDLASLIERHFGADVALSPLGTAVDGLCAHTQDQALLVASSDFPDGHVRFTLAHELGHHLLSDTREVIVEGAGDMFDGDILERRVNAFAAHLLLPEDGVRDALAWLAVSGGELREGGVRAERVLGTLMQRFGVSLQALLFHLAGMGVITFDDAGTLKANLRATDVSRSLAPIRALSSPLQDPIEGTVRPPQRLLESALAAARAGTIGTGTLALLLEREDDDALFDAVMGDAPDEAPQPLMFPSPE